MNRMRMGFVCLVVLLNASLASADEDGRALAEKTLAYAGGKAKVESIHTLRLTGSMSNVTPRGTMQAEVKSLMRFPDAFRMEITTPNGPMTRVITPSVAFMTARGQSQDLAPAQREEAMEGMRTDFVAVLKNIGNPKYSFTAGATEKIGDVEARVLEIDAGGARTTWHVDPATGKVLRTSRGDGANAEHVEWKTFDGLTLPATTVIFRNGEKVGEVHLAAVEVNPAVEAGVWEK